MIRLVYASTLIHGLAGATVDAIVEQAARRNAEAGITGILTLEGDRICQVLEGPEQSVRSLYDRIARDERHYGVVEIDCRPVENRAFPTWSMARRPTVDIVVMALTAGYTGAHSPDARLGLGTNQRLHAFNE